MHKTLQTPYSRRAVLLVALALVGATIIAYAHVLGCGFVEYDDTVYVTENFRVQAGLTWDNIRWAFTTFFFSNWHPLAWLSHMLDCNLSGLRPGGHHATSLILHLVNTLLLLAILRRATGSLWRSAFVATVFALHPLHVESVAWIAERKDVLSAFFGLLAIWAYIAYAERRHVPRYLLVLCLFALGLMAKAMVITLPGILLLLDVWPLRRLDLAKPLDKATMARAAGLLLEKTPLFALSVAAALLNILAQGRSGAVASFEAFSMRARIANALISYIAYIGKAIWPVRLAVLYPHPGEDVSIGYAVAAAGLLAVISAAALMWARRRPYLLVGWLWYVVMLLPVIGIVQVGSQAMADRYAYLPLIGLSIMLAWSIPERLLESRSAHTGLAACGILILAAMTAKTWDQVRYWRDGEALFRHALAVTEDNAIAHSGLGDALWRQGRADEAIEHLRAALAIAPDLGEAHNNLGVALCEQGAMDEGLDHLKAATRLRPENPRWACNLANALVEQGKADEAARFYRRVLEIDADCYQAHNGLGSILLEAADYERAAGHFAKAIELDPKSAEAHANLGAALAAQGDGAAAAEQLFEALRLQPENAPAHVNLGVLMAQQGDTAAAVEHFTDALRIDPAHPDAHYNLAIALMGNGQPRQAREHLETALASRPDWAAARELLEDIARQAADSPQAAPGAHPGE